MKNKEIVGIDVSKKVLDIYILSEKYHFKISNDPGGFADLIEICAGKLGDRFENVFFSFEDTGRYSKLLSVFLQESQFQFAALNALDIKRSMGLIRGKTDKKDARMIALYAWRKRDELNVTNLSGPIIDQLKQLLTLREKLIKHRTAFKNAGKDLHDCYTDGEFSFIKERHTSMLLHLNSEIDLVEKELFRIINLHEELADNYRLLLSIRGIGKVLALYLITLTDNFTKFLSPRKFACYAGIAPFEYSSGSSVKGRTKVHPCANKQIKSLLNMAAMSSIQLNGEYKTYYLRRLSEGKNKMSTLNIIRNKLVFRAFAVVKRRTPYVDLCRFAA
jgi:transposase